MVVLVMAALSSGNHSDLKGAKASHCLQVALLGKKHPKTSLSPKTSLLLLGVLLNVLNRCRLFLCSCHACIPSHLLS